MTHSIDFKRIEEKLFLIQNIVLASRAYSEERDIGRHIKPYGEGSWSDYSGQLQELVSSYSIECAIKTRMAQDFILEKSNDVDLATMAKIDKEARAGFSVGHIHSGSFDLTVRESCNKIIHATKVELNWVEVPLGKSRKRVEYWNGGYHLHGKHGILFWHVELDMRAWAIAMENFHLILDERVDWSRIYDLESL